MATRPRLREQTAEAIEAVKRDHDYATTDRAVAHLLREAGYEA